MAHPLRLVTIPISHYCEKARWALDRAGIPYVEEAHPPLFHLLHTRRLGPVRSTPQLVGPDLHLTSSAAIVRYADACRDELFPSGSAVRAEVAAWVERFDDQLGPHVRRYAYHHLLDHPDLVLPLCSRGAPRWDATATRVAFVPIRNAMRRGMRIDAAGAARSLEKLTAVLDAVDARLADGRRWLVEDRFSAADLTLASLLGPMAAPAELALPALDRIPAELARTIHAIRGRPAGGLVIRAYAAERNQRPSR